MIVPTPTRTDASSEVVIVGAGACGLIAALRAHAAGAEVTLLERDPSPSGSTSLSSGFVPAAGTRFQRACGVHDDSTDLFKTDIQAKAHGTAEPSLVDLAVDNIAPALEWLADHCQLQWQVLDDFLYPGHARHRMHAVTEKTGAALQAQLLAAVAATDITLLTQARVTALCSPNRRHIDAVQITRPDNSTETLACGKLLLACNGFAGNPQLVQRYIPAIASGPYFGHRGNTGDALLWGQAMDLQLKHLGAYQGHGSVAEPHGILISWALMMEGGIQVNQLGQRFASEHEGYSEQAQKVLAQPNGVAWCVYDQRIHEFAMGFPDYQQALQAGAIVSAASVEAFACISGLPVDPLAASLEQVQQLAMTDGVDSFGRQFPCHQRLQPAYFGVKVTGALFHTQGGLMVDHSCRVVDRDGVALANLFAAGGAACGVSGEHVSGYLSGNGLLTAIALGFVAGAACANVGVEG